MIRINGSICLPGDKSISHRALMLASLSDGESIINNISTGKDVESTRQCLLQCGIESYHLNDLVYIKGGTFKNPNMPLDCGNSGTTARLLIGLLAGKNISAELFGDQSLSKRPMNRIIEPLLKMGLEIKSNNGYLPLSITAKPLQGIKYKLPVASAQVKSSIMLAGLGANSQTVINEKYLTRNHTEIMLEKLGADVVIDDEIKISRLLKPLRKFELNTPSDPSSAAFFAALAAMIPNSELKIKNILINPTRIGIYNILEKMGSCIKWMNKRQELGENIADLHISSKPLNGIDITEDLIPSIIDEIPIIAIVASQADSPTAISGAQELRLKESDRIRAICQNLSNMGCDIIERNDGFIINPINRLYSTNIKTYGDHRIAMAFSIASYITEGENVLDDPNCIDISFPEFNTVLKSIII